MRLSARHSLAPLVPALVLLAVPGAARADPVLQQILADSARTPVVGFERTTRAAVRADPEKEPGLLVDRFTPTGAATGTWTLVSIDGRKPTAEEARAHQRANNVIPGFHRLHKVLAGTPASRREAGGRTIYRWNALPAGAVVTPGGDISSHLSAEAVVEQVNGRPLIAEVRIFAAEPFSIRGIARMNAFEVVSRYRPGADGKPFLTAQTSASDVKAPFGLGGKRRSDISFRPL